MNLSGKTMKNTVDWEYRYMMLYYFTSGPTFHRIEAAAEGLSSRLGRQQKRSTKLQRKSQFSFSHFSIPYKQIDKIHIAILIKDLDCLHVV